MNPTGANGMTMNDLATAETFEKIFFELRKVIVGQSRLLERLLVGVLCRGHCLLESVPGLAKTLAAETLANVVGGSFARIQFTPDLLPSDIVGTRIYRAGSETFDVELGPVFVNFLLTDEINRAPAKVQSALLEVMAEQQVTIGGITHPVEPPFFVVATQNPIESEGVYQLPDAQRDRFMMKIVLDHPTADDEMAILDRMAVASAAPTPNQVISLDELIALQERADQVFVDRSVMQYAVDVVQCTRYPDRYKLADLGPMIGLGASPRASLNLVKGARAMAMLRGRSYATPQDVFDLAPEVLRHRLLLTYDALARDITRRSHHPTHSRHRAGQLGLAQAERRLRPELTLADRPVDRHDSPARPTHWAQGPPTDTVTELLRTLELTISRRLDGVLHGNYQGLTPGHGSEPGESRPYAPGDDVRRIDWNVTARTQETYIREQIADRDLTAWLVVDASATMQFGTVTNTKAQTALAATAAVGSSLLGIRTESAR